MEDYNPSDEAAAIAPQGWFLEWDFLTKEQKTWPLDHPECQVMQCIVEMARLDVVEAEEK